MNAIDFSICSKQYIFLMMTIRTCYILLITLDLGDVFFRQVTKPKRKTCKSRVTSSASMMLFRSRPSGCFWRMYAAKLLLFESVCFTYSDECGSDLNLKFEVRSYLSEYVWWNSCFLCACMYLRRKLYKMQYVGTHEVATSVYNFKPISWTLLQCLISQYNSGVSFRFYQRCTHWV